jgi:hypothetical protein
LGSDDDLVVGDVSTLASSAKLLAVTDHEQYLCASLALLGLMPRRVL